MAVAEAVGSTLLTRAEAPHQTTITSLTSLRFFAAIAIVFLHFSKFLPLGVTDDSFWIQNARMGVDFFFVLSGFIMAHCYLRQIEQGRFDVVQFLRKRFARIFPLHIATMLPFVGLLIGMELDLVKVSQPDAYRWNAVLPNILLIHGWGTAGGLTFNYPSWSVSAEWFAYLLFLPICIVFFNRRISPFVGVAVAALFFGALVVITEPLMGRSLVRLTHDFSILRILPEFILGIAVYRLSREWDLAAGLCMPVLLASALIMGTLFPLYDSPPVVVLVFAAVIFAVASLERQDGVTLLRNPVLVYLGEISFSIYMVHAIIEIFVMNSLNRILPAGAGSDLVIWAVGMALVFVVAAMTHRWLEVPARRWLGGTTGTRVSARPQEHGAGAA